MKNFLLIIIVLFNFSCNVQKHKFKKQVKTREITNTKIKEVEYRFRILPKDSILFVPKIIYNDTTITKKGKLTILKVNYNKQGLVKQAQCLTNGKSEFSIIKRDVEENKIKDTKAKETEKSTIIKKDYSIYILILVSLIIIYLIIDKLKR